MCSIFSFNKDKTSGVNEVNEYKKMTDTTDITLNLDSKLIGSLTFIIKTTLIRSDYNFNQ